MNAAEGASLLQVSAVLFAIAALGGITMAGIRFARAINPPAWLAMLHGLLAAAGLTLLAYDVFVHGAGAAACAALALFCLAAAGGAVLSLRYKWNRVLLPAWLVVGHALAAVAGFVAVVFAAFIASG